MADYRELGERVEAFLQSYDQICTDELRALAQDYAQAVGEVNRHLRQCGEYLRSGLKAEAVHLAEQEPPLLDRVAALELSAPDEWRQLCAGYELPVPENLLHEVADAVQEAYDEQLESSDLLIRHRRLALARAPLPLRIEVLRQLAESDPNAPFWFEDLQDFEQARFREIGDLARAALQRGDVKSLKSVHQELTSSAWTSPPPETLLKSVQKYATKAVRARGLEEITKVTPQLVQAFQQGDVTAARSLRQQWQKAAASANVNGDHDLTRQARPALDWLTEEDERQRREAVYGKTLATLRSALENGEDDAEELRRLVYQIENVGYELPEETRRQVAARVHSLETVRKREWVAKTAFAVAGVALVVLIIGVAVYQSSHAEKVERIATEIRARLDEGQLADARQLFDEHRNISNNDEWLKLRSDLETAERDEEQRLAAFSAAIEQAEQSVDDPLTARSHLGNAEQVAKTGDEKLRVARLESAIARTEREQAARRVEKFEQAFAATSKALDELEQRIGDGTDHDALQTHYATARNNLTALKAARVLVNTEVAAKADILAVRFDQLQSQVQAAARRRSLIEELVRITGRAGQLEPAAFARQYQDALDDYLAGNESPQAERLKRAAGEVPLWEAALEWQARRSAWKGILPATDAEAADRLAVINAYLQKINPADATTRQAVADYGRSLQAFRKRFQEDNPAERLRRAFQSPLVGGPLFVLTKKSNRFHRYYLTSMDDLSVGSVVNARHVGSVSGTLVRTAAIDRDSLAGTDLAVAPQVTLSKRIIKELSQPLATEWRQRFLVLSREVLEADDVDPILRLGLLDLVLEQACEGDAGLQVVLSELRDKLDSDDVDLAARWFDPADERADASRVAAGKVLAGVTAAELERLFEFAEAHDGDLWRRVSAGRIAVAGVLTHENGHWLCRPEVDMPETAELAVLVRGDHKRSRWLELRASGAGLEPGPLDDSTAMAEGRLVFFRHASVQK